MSKQLSKQQIESEMDRLQRQRDDMMSRVSLYDIQIEALKKALKTVKDE